MNSLDALKRLRTAGNIQSGFPYEQESSVYAKFTSGSYAINQDCNIVETDLIIFEKLCELINNNKIIYKEIQNELNLSNSEMEMNFHLNKKKGE